MSKVLEHYTVPTADGVKRMRYVSRVDFRNLGLSFGGFHTFAVLTPWGNLLACKWDKRLFSYRYGYRDCVRVLGLCVYWVRLKRAEGDPLDTGNELSEKPTMPKLQTTKTRPRQWLEAKRFHSDDACLIYPFALLTGIAARRAKSRSPR